MLLCRVLELQLALYSNVIVILLPYLLVQLIIKLLMVKSKYMYRLRELDTCS